MTPEYQKYLCSREWAVRKRAVHERAGGICERCRLNPIDFVHHLTYANIYNEPLTDLEGWCRSCHDFIHAKSDIDPAADGQSAIETTVEEWSEPITRSENEFIFLFHRAIRKALIGNVDFDLWRSIKERWHGYVERQKVIEHFRGIIKDAVLLADTNEISKLALDDLVAERSHALIVHAFNASGNEHQRRYNAVVVIIRDLVEKEIANLVPDESNKIVSVNGSEWTENSYLVYMRTEQWISSTTMSIAFNDDDDRAESVVGHTVGKPA